MDDKEMLEQELITIEEEIREIEEDIREHDLQMSKLPEYQLPDAMEYHAQLMEIRRDTLFALNKLYARLDPRNI